jgi:S-(hydroxymethyl)glutathione dehydrogenase/alcohol dehydrogenase
MRQDSGAHPLAVRRVAWIPGTHRLGSAVNAAETKPGDVIIVVGVGGIGMGAVQGAAHAGATRIIAVDPVAFKREMSSVFGATDAFATIEEATELARSVTNGQGADATILAVGVLKSADVAMAVNSVRKGGTVVVTAVARADAVGMPVNLLQFAMFQKRIQGVLFGMMSPAKDVTRLLSIYEQGQLKLDEMVTRTYALDEINQGYDDLHASTNLRGVVVF